MTFDPWLEHVTRNFVIVGSHLKFCLSVLKGWGDDVIKNYNNNDKSKNSDHISQGGGGGGGMAGQRAEKRTDGGIGFGAT